MKGKIELNSVKHADLGKSRSDGSIIEDTRNRWQRIFDEKYRDVGRFSVGLERWVW